MRGEREKNKQCFFLCLLATINNYSWLFTVVRRQKNLPLAPPMFGNNWRSWC